MDFDLPEDLQEIKKKAREFALKELTPEVARKYDRDRSFLRN